jgi:hypothetical protein
VRFIRFSRTRAGDVTPRSPGQPFDQPRRFLGLGDVRLAGERRDQHGVGTGHGDSGGPVAEAGGIHQHQISGTVLCVDQMRQPRLIGLGEAGEGRSLVSVLRPPGERGRWVGVERHDLHPIGGQPAGEQHGHRGLARTALAAGDRENGHGHSPARLRLDV